MDVACGKTETTGNGGGHPSIARIGLMSGGRPSIVAVVAFMGLYWHQLLWQMLAQRGVLIFFISHGGTSGGNHFPFLFFAGTRLLTSTVLLIAAY